MATVRVENLTLKFGTLAVLESLDLEVHEGEFLVLLGPSGCGKSTLLNCIAGLLDISEGSISIGDRNVTWEEPKDRGIGMVFQSYALYPQMSVERNLSFGLRVAGLPRQEVRQRVAKAAAMLQIEPLLQRKPAALSGGQRQRVAIGRALVRDVDVFLFDEPLSNLDAKLRSELRVEIKRLHRTLSSTMIYVTHDQIEALTLADRIAVMKGGVIQQLADPQTLYNRPKNVFVAGFIGSSAMNMLPGELRAANGTAAFHLGDAPLPLTDYQAEADLPAQRDAILGLRPEHIRLGGDAADASVTLEGTVDFEEPMGADALVWLDIMGHRLSARIESGRGLRSGDRVPVHLSMGSASIFDRKTEQRV